MDLRLSLRIVPASCVLVWCKACHHLAQADLQEIIDVGRGDQPLKDLKFRAPSAAAG
jgi:hypothetical protein